MGWRLIDPIRHSRSQPAGAPDIAGAAAVTLFLAALSFALIEGQPTGWSSPAVLIAVAIAALMLAGFLAIERGLTRRADSR